MSKKLANKWIVLMFICLGGGIIYIMPYIQYSYYDILMEALGLTNQQMGDLMSLLGIISSFAYLIGGIFADKFNVKWLITISLTVAGAAGLWFASFPSYGQLQIIMVIYGVSTIMLYWPAVVKAVKMLGSEEEQGRMFGFRECGVNLFPLVFTQVGTWLVFNRVGGVDGVRNIMIYYCIIYFVAAILSFIFIPNSTKDKQEKVENKEVSTLQGIIYIAKIPSVWLIGLTIFCVYSVSGAGLGKLTPYFTSVLGMDEALVSSLMSIRMYLIGFVAAALGGLIADKIKSASKFLIGAYAGLFASLLALYWIPGTAATVVGVVIIGLLASAFVYSMRGTYFSPMGQARIPDVYVGTAAGLISFIGFLPDAFMNSVFGRIMGDAPGEAEFKSIFLICLILAAVGCGLAFFSHISIKKRQEKTPVLEKTAE